MAKGITPIFSIIILLLITVSLVGATWMFISSYFSGLTGQRVSVVDSDCFGNLATLYVRNTGTEPIKIDTCIGHSNSYQCGDVALVVLQENDSGVPIWQPKTIEAGDYADLGSTCSGVCQYRLILPAATEHIDTFCSTENVMSGGVTDSSIFFQFSEETELETIVLSSTLVRMSCTKINSTAYRCTGDGQTVICETFDKKTYTCSVPNVETHTEAQVYGAASSGSPSGGKVRLTRECNPPGKTASCGTDVGECVSGLKT